MTKKLITWVTKEEFEKLFKAEEERPMKLAMLLAFEAGMRISEILGLKNKDGTWKIKPLEKQQVDLDRHTILIISGKGDKDRIVPLPKRFNENALKLLPLSKHFSRRTFQRRVKQLGLKILNKEITPHKYRHGFGSHLAEKRPLHEVQMLMGHSRLDTTGRYLHANPKQAVEGARDVF